MYYREFRNCPYETFEELYDESAFSHDPDKRLHAFRESTTDTVVFHPKDSSTDFLKAIYEGKKFTVVSDMFPDDKEVQELIQEHDRVVCLGHGSPEGLFGGFGMVINDAHAELLKDKEVVAIWCHANQYMEKHGLHGFYSGMFVSEEIEARYIGIKASHQQIQHSNEQFAIALGKYIDDEEILQKIRFEYKKKGDPVVEFNRARLFST
jgi:hypothetical protein